MQSASNLLDDDPQHITAAADGGGGEVHTLFQALQMNDKDSSSSSSVVDPLADGYESVEDEISSSSSSIPRICSCKPWIISRGKDLCPDLRKCEYVKNVQAVQRLREQPSRQLCFTCNNDPSCDLTSSSPSSSSSAAAAASESDSPVTCFNCPCHFTLYIPQSSSTMNDGFGWTNHGGGDATGNVIWAAAIFTCKLLHAFKKRQQNVLQTAVPGTLLSSQSSSAAAILPFFNTHPVTSLELGCGSALISLYLSLISHPSALILASDQNTKIVRDLQHRIAIGVEKGGWLPHQKEGELRSHVEENFRPPCSSEETYVQLAKQLKERLQRVKVLEYEWNEPLLTTSSLSVVRGDADNSPPSLIIGSDILYFSISYPKLCMTIWELFENVLFEAKKPRLQDPSAAPIPNFTSEEQILVSWMNKKARVIAKQPDSSKQMESPPLLLLTQKCRHAETEQDFWLAVSNFAHVYQVKPSFIHQLQQQTQSRSDSNQAANTSTPSTMSTTTAVIDPQPSLAQDEEEVHDLEGIALDSLPFDALDPFLQIFFAIPKLEKVSSNPSDSSSAAASNLTNDIDMEEWQRQLSRERVWSFLPAPALDMHSTTTHWLLKHFPASAIASWQPQLSFS